MILAVYVQGNFWKNINIDGDSYQWGQIVEAVYAGIDSGDLVGLNPADGLQIEAKPV